MHGRKKKKKKKKKKKRENNTRPTTPFLPLVPVVYYISLNADVFKLKEIENFFLISF